MKREEIAETIRLIWQSEFVQAVRRLLEGGALLYIFLLIEHELVRQARASLGEGVENSIVTIILNGIEIGSALGVAVLFLLHFAAVAFHYTRYIFK